MRAVIGRIVGETGQADFSNVLVDVRVQESRRYFRRRQGRTTFRVRNVVHDYGVYLVVVDDHMCILSERSASSAGGSMFTRIVRASCRRVGPSTPRRVSLDTARHFAQNPFATCAPPSLGAEPIKTLCD